MPSNKISVTQDLTTADLDRLLAQPEVAMDTETLGLNPLRDRVCLLQICDRNGTVNLVRSHDWRQAENIKVFLSSAVTKVFHHAVFDCSMLLAQTGVEVGHPYCTKIASKIARTYSNSHSLASIVQELLNVELPKKMQTSDWLGKLTPEQVEYAANDVRHLLKVKHLLEAKLELRGTLPTGLSFTELNVRCQSMIPTLVQLKLNGWTFEEAGASNVFTH